MNNETTKNQDKGLNLALPADVFYTFVKGVSELTDEASITLTSEGALVKSMDPSSISMVSARIPAKLFSKYQLPDGVKEHKVGLNMENLAKMIPKKDGIVEITQKVGNSIFMVSMTRDGITERHELPVFDVKKEPDKEPKIEYEAMVCLNGAVFKEILKKANRVSTHMNIIANQNELGFHSEGDAGKFDMSIPRENFTKESRKFAVNGSKTVNTVFNLDYLERIASTSDKRTSVELDLKSSDPIRITYTLNGIELCYFLAPYMTG